MGIITWESIADSPRLLPLIRSMLVLLIGIPLVYALSSAAGRAATKRVTAQAGMILRKTIFYGGLAVLLITVLHDLGFKLAAILGAAGILGVAIGFASQTSLSNIISGLFLVWERTFEVGDMIQAGDTLGIVLSIDLLSVKVRTTDNRYIRLPNESLIKSQVINVTRFPIRRMDINIGVAYKENIGRVMEVLLEVVDRNPYALHEPRPLILFKDFGSSALDLLVGIWFAKQDFLNLKNSIMREIKERFDQEGIEIAFPHLTLYSGSETEPFPVRVIEPEVKK